ncbi:6-bladed beta-propeller [Algoriphagus halophytocola]|uniref:6-bladed beta-propeller n=1 Tax=Algoriphagus halophytocola TaxID=2991499 RepID=A0ABY6MMT2_9BACT|nr:MULTISPECIES: 6-bladed beta-propeller [unclassified Algoriphagus]UZD23514.1 6-bladed beta-propeller [Algoriphagus sp. TR-M5]WBL44808.1 6-bladed beta-propeller [Algoriphagus sp. TR-M9]
MKQTYTLSVLFMCYIFVSCSSGEKGNSAAGNDELEIIKVDLSEAREGKLSEFFEPEIEYIWLKDDSEEAQLNAGLHQISFSEDRIFTLDIFGCKCIKVFDRSGNYLNNIKAYGEGPGQYLDLDKFMVVMDEIIISGVHPPKLMWFDVEGNFIREAKQKIHISSVAYDENAERYYFLKSIHEAEDFMVMSLNSEFQDTLYMVPRYPDQYFGNYSSRDYFINNQDHIYFSMTYHDTIYKVQEGEFMPQLVLDFGEYGQDLNEFRKKMDELEGLEMMDFINKKTKLQFVPNSWFLNENYFYSVFKYEEKSYNVFFERETQQTSVIDWIIQDDIDKGYNPYSINYHFDQNKVGNKVSGKSLYKELQKKKAELGQEGFEEFVNGKGKNFAEAAFAAKDSENPVLIVYTVKK